MISCADFSGNKILWPTRFGQMGGQWEINIRAKRSNCPGLGKGKITGLRLRKLSTQKLRERKCARDRPGLRKNLAYEGGRGKIRLLTSVIAQIRDSAYENLNIALAYENIDMPMCRPVATGAQRGIAPQKSLCPPRISLMVMTLSPHSLLVDGCPVHL